MKNVYIKGIFSSLATLWILNVFLGSIPYKFSGHPHTQHIFGTIGEWMKGIFGQAIGNGFADYGAYVIGSGEIIVSLILIIPVVFYIGKLLGFLKSKTTPEYLFALGGLGASALMAGAVFFHLFTPLGIEVNGDGGSLFRAAVSILILGLIFAGIHGCSLIRILKDILPLKK